MIEGKKSRRIGIRYMWCSRYAPATRYAVPYRKHAFQRPKTPENVGFMRFLRFC